MPPTKYYKRPIPAEIQGVVVDGKRLGSTLYVPLRNGMTVADAAAYRELLISRAHQLVNFRLTETDAWELATSICDAHEALRKQGMSYYEEFKLAILGRGPDAREWLRRMGRQLSFEDEAKVAQWIERVHSQRLRLNLVADLMALDDPGALRGEPVAEPSTRTTHFSQVQSVRIAAGKRPLHSELTKQFLETKERSLGYRPALAQFLGVCSDKDAAI